MCVCVCLCVFGVCLAIFSREADIGFFFYDYFWIKLSDGGRWTVTLMHDHGFDDEFFLLPRMWERNRVYHPPHLSVTVQSSANERIR